VGELQMMQPTTQSMASAMEVTAINGFCNGVAACTKTAATPSVLSREDDAHSTSASSAHGDGTNDLHTGSSSDEECEVGRLASPKSTMRTPSKTLYPPKATDESCEQCGKFVSDAALARPVQPPPGLPAPAAQTQRGLVAPPPGLAAPFSLRPPPGFALLPAHLSLIAGHAETEMPQSSFQYTPQAFRREAARILRELKLHKNAGLAVRQVRACNVPRQRQAAEFADILTFVAEESRGPARRTGIAFVGGLTKAFEKEACIAGLRLFFHEVYPELLGDVPRLGTIVLTELVPTLKEVFPAEELGDFLPSIMTILCSP